MGSGRVFLTGATGFVGSVLAARLLRRGFSVGALARRRNGTPAPERLQRAILAVDPGAPLGRLAALEGDITRPLLGFSPRAVRRVLEGVDRVIHCAATLRYRRKDLDWILAHNVTGTRNVLEAITGTTDPRRVRFCHVSTAYSCGKPRGPARERVPVGLSGFNNAYEWSKARAETLVTEASARTGLMATILRPGVIVGAAGDGRGKAPPGYNSFVKMLLRFAKEAMPAPLHVVANSRARIHLTPVGEVADCAIRALEAPGGDPPRIVTVTPETPPTVGEAFELALENSGTAPAVLVSARDYPERKMTPVERRFRKVMAFYSPYILNDYDFAVSGFALLMGRPLGISRSFLRKVNASFLVSRPPLEAYAGSL